MDVGFAACITSSPFPTIDLFIAVSPINDSLLFLGKPVLSEIIVFDCVSVDHGDRLF